MNLRWIFVLVILTGFHAASAKAAERTYSLQDAYQSALGNNEIVKISEEAVVQADSTVDQAWTYVYPRLTGNAGYT